MHATPLFRSHRVRLPSQSTADWDQRDSHRHINKGPTEASEQKPFGSAFSFNSVRSVWNIKAVTGSAGDTMSVAFYHRKANLGRLLPAVRVEVTFTDDRTEIRRANVGDVAELAAGLPLWERIRQGVRRGPVTLALIAEELDAKPGHRIVLLRLVGAERLPAIGRQILQRGRRDDGLKPQHRWNSCSRPDPDSIAMLTILAKLPFRQPVPGGSR